MVGFRKSRTPKKLQLERLPGRSKCTGVPNVAELTRWIPGLYGQAQRDSRLRVLCFPYAGAGASIFRGWQGTVPDGAEILPIQLPGMENRWIEPPFLNLESPVRTLAVGLRPLLTKPYALFGHSMGGLICFELARQLRRDKVQAPVQLFISGARPPHIPDRELPLGGLSDSAFLARLTGGAPDHALRDPELAQALLPILRADFTLCETYIPAAEEPLGFQLQIFPGDHLFLMRSRNSLLRVFSDGLSRLSTRR